MAQTKPFEEVPELSLKQYIDGNDEDKAHFSRELFKGLKKYGFIVLREHPINMDLLEKSYFLSEQLFALPETTKHSYISPDGGGQRGYTPFAQEHAKDRSVPDLKEFWHIGREKVEKHRPAEEFPRNIWPREIPEFKDTFLQMYTALEDVGKTLLEALTGPLEVPSDYFEKMVYHGSSVLRLLHYPPIPEDADPRSIRAAPHEDINLITILVSASASGLQLKLRNGEWLPIETDPNNLIVDSGDMLARLTNEVIPATTHRVVNPEGENKSRYSMPFFLHPNPEAVLSCLDSCRGEKAKYPDITAQDFLMERLREIGLT